MKLERAVVGIDFCDASVTALRWAATHLVPAGELVLVHCIAEVAPRSDDRAPDGQEDAERRLRELAHQVAVACPAARVFAEVRSGRPAERLVERAHELAADLLIVGKHGKRAAPWDWLGSTAEGALLAAELPVLMVTDPRHESPREVLVALDEGDVLPWVVDWARFLAERFGARIDGLHVRRALTIATELSLAGVGAGPGGGDRASLEAELAADTARWQQVLREGGLGANSASVQTVVGDPVQEILETAGRVGADLILTGNRRTDGRMRTMLGSVVRGVLRGARCPVLVATEPVDEIVPAVDD